jgi:hypothetical protein
VIIGVTEVSVVEEPDVSHIEDLIVGASEELVEVHWGLKESDNQIRVEDHFDGPE